MGLEKVEIFSLSDPIFPNFGLSILLSIFVE